MGVNREVHFREESLATFVLKIYKVGAKQKKKDQASMVSSLHRYIYHDDLGVLFSIW